MALPAANAANAQGFVAFVAFNYRGPGYQVFSCESGGVLKNPVEESSRHWGYPTSLRRLRVGAG